MACPQLLGQRQYFQRQLILEVNDNLDKFELGVAVSKLYDFIWDIYCDWYIELTKPRIAAGGETEATAQAVLVWVMKGMLKMLHPFMPYITEDYPVYDEKLEFADEEATFEKIIAGIKSIRNCRGEMNVPPSVKAKLYIETAQPEVFSQGVMFFERLASASEVIITDKCEEKDCAAAVTDSARFFIPLADIIDVDKELARLDKDRKNAQKDIDFLSKKLSNQGFLAKAPEQLIEAEKAKLAKAEEKMSKIMESISALEARK